MALVHPITYMTIDSAPTVIEFHQPKEKQDGFLMVGNSEGQVQVWNLQSWNCHQIIQVYSEESTPIRWICVCDNVLIVEGRLAKMKIYVENSYGFWIESKDFDIDEDIESGLDHQGYCHGDWFDKCLLMPKGESEVVVIDVMDLKLKLKTVIKGT